MWHGAQDRRRQPAERWRVDRYVGQQRRAARPVPRVRQQGAGRPKERARPAQAGHHQRQGAGALAEPTEIRSLGGMRAAAGFPAGGLRRGAPREDALRLELHGITKRFGDLVANDRIDLTVEPGEIHARLGENGAGKSTLMNILYGLLHPDEGEIVVDGQARRFRNPGDAIAAGIGMVHQHFMLVPVFTVAENIMLGAEPTGPAGVLDRGTARARGAEVSKRYRLPVDPDATVADLPVGVQQRVEIIKALVREVDLLILDEPTAVLTPQEIDELLDVMRTLKDAGKSIVFITHKLKEVKAIADRITVVRRGAIVGTARPDASEDELAALMVGRTVKLKVDKAPARPADPVLEVRDLVVYDERGHRAVDGTSLEVRAGEVLGIAGVQGNGQTELVEAIMGLRPVTGGVVSLLGLDPTGRATQEIPAARGGDVAEG